ncbi:hypothetical protein [Nitrobacter winogradskyi]|uniref:Uncharacterized protein n=1 Tax=Nitrobacter winogradskyi TaxID=913 RepID=A0ACC6AIV5_NITWI|nr:hypothetical protein [Nitrobacter winogradskyi]MCP1999694.1 hypothetical protein [Nitrobacter winogradskyi]
MTPETARVVVERAISDEYPTCQPVTRLNASTAEESGWAGIEN